MNVREIMTATVVTVSPDTPFADVAEMLVGNGLSAVPVVENGVVVGIVTEYDLLPKEAFPPRRERRRLGRAITDAILGPDEVTIKAAGKTAGDLMTSPAVTISPDATVRTAARKMLEERVKRLPVVVDGRIVGIVSRHDILTVFARSDREIWENVRSILDRAMYVRPDADITIAVADGAVTLGGSVPYPSDATIAANLAAEVDGVVRVDNNLRPAEPEPRLRPPAEDPWNVMTR